MVPPSSNTVGSLSTCGQQHYATASANPLPAQPAAFRETSRRLASLRLRATLRDLATHSPSEAGARTADSYGYGRFPSAEYLSAAGAAALDHKECAEALTRHAAVSYEPPPTESSSAQLLYQAFGKSESRARVAALTQCDLGERLYLRHIVAQHDATVAVLQAKHIGEVAQDPSQGWVHCDSQEELRIRIELQLTAALTANADARDRVRIVVDDGQGKIRKLAMARGAYANTWAKTVLGARA